MRRGCCFLNNEVGVSSYNTNFILVNRSQLTAINCSDVGTSREDFRMSEFILEQYKFHCG